MQLMRNQKVPTMAEHSLVPEDELVGLYPPFNIDDNGDVVQGLNAMHDAAGDGNNIVDNSFVFDIDQSVLVDPRCILLEKMIGEGGYSVVYQGWYKGMPVAVKIIQPCNTSAVTREHKEKFQREVTMLSRMAHDNIVKFVGAAVEPSMMILTENLRGGTLQKFLWNIRPMQLDLKLSLRFALDISRAMEHLHANGIIHRDLKPRNILLTDDQMKIKLVDFGLAREEIKGGMTCEAGTYRWMAPELFSKDPLFVGEKKHYDHKVDVYSFAIVFWEMLTNKPPFHGKSNILVAYAASNNVRPSLENIPPDIGTLLEYCWAENPEMRPEFKVISKSIRYLLRNLSPPEPAPEIITEPAQNTIVIEEKEEEKAVENEEEKAVENAPPMNEPEVIQIQVQDEAETKKKTKTKPSLFSIFKRFRCCLVGR